MKAPYSPITTTRLEKNCSFRCCSFVYFITIAFLAIILDSGSKLFVSSWSLPNNNANQKSAFLSTTRAKNNAAIIHYRTTALYMAKNEEDYLDDTDEEDLLEPPVLDTFDSYDEEELDPTDVQSLTVAQLKQQLRLRGLKVSGKKSDLVERLISFCPTPDKNDENDQQQQQQELLEPIVPPTKKLSKAQREAAKHGKELVDITEYLDEEDQGKDFKSSIPLEDPEEDDDDAVAGSNNVNSESSGEVWGSEAKIVDDYEGRRLVVDSMMQTVVEFRGSNQSYVQSYVVASRDALKAFLAGGSSSNETMTPAEERLRQIQVEREKAEAAKLSTRDYQDGLDEGDEIGLYNNILHREFSDWGKYTVTGAQISAQEVQGILLLSDVYGPFSEDTKALADKIAFECQPVVVMVPDLFRGDPWKEEMIEDDNGNKKPSGLDKKGRTYEEWRATHSDLRVSVDIRAAAAVLREQYGVSSVVVWGTCYGGGRALEQAAGVLPDGNIHDIDGSIGPPPVDPMAVVAWYPTRYNARELFGADPEDYWTNMEEREVAVMAVFAGKDVIPGATPEDAELLKSLLEEDERVKDHMVKVFPEREHGFAHIGLAGKEDDVEESDFTRFVDEEFGGAGRVSMHEGDAEVACLLSTAFMETYSRVFLPTVGPPITQDQAASEWNENIEIKNLEESASRDVREEIEEAEANFVAEPLDNGNLIDPAELATDESQQKALEERLRAMQPDDVTGPYKIEPDDDIEMMLQKLKASDENFQLF